MTYEVTASGKNTVQVYKLTQITQVIPCLYDIQLYVYLLH